jgi:hypothetical protein
MGAAFVVAVFAPAAFAGERAALAEDVRVGVDEGVPVGATVGAAAGDALEDGAGVGMGEVAVPVGSGRAGAGLRWPGDVRRAWPDAWPAAALAVAWDGRAAAAPEASAAVPGLVCSGTS